MSNRVRAIKPAITALAVLLFFIVAFVAFILAPLLLVALVVGSMWGYERFNNSRKQPGVRALTTPRSLAGGADAQRAGDSGEPTYGFGSGLGRDL